MQIISPRMASERRRTKLESPQSRMTAAMAKSLAHTTNKYNIFGCSTLKGLNRKTFVVSACGIVCYTTSNKDGCLVNC